MSAKRTKEAHKISSRYRLILTGTPVMNQLDDFYSLVTFFSHGIGLIGNRLKVNFMLFTFLVKVVFNLESKHQIWLNSELNTKIRLKMRERKTRGQMIFGLGIREQLS